MIFLKSHNLIFLKTRKTAGTSIEIALSANASEQDIIAPIVLKDEFLRMDPPFRHAQNWGRSKMAERILYAEARRFRTASVPKWRLALFQYGKRKNAHFRNHMSAANLISTIGQSTFDDSFKVASIRHPYEALLSKAMNAFTRHGQTASLNDLIEHRLNARTVRNFDIIAIDGKLAVDFVVRFESLKDDLAALEEKTGLKLLQHLPHTKGDRRRDHRPARDVLTQDQMDRCFQKNREEFDVFGYER